MSFSEHYEPKKIEPKWQGHWEEHRSFEVREEAAKPKFYLLEMFPYPSGRIHMGHVRNYTIGDVLARFLKMRGYNVLHPMGWDAFGMPAENAAIKNKTHPAAWTEQNIEIMRGQLQRLGFSYDWDREIATCRPEYYRWEQKIFIEMFEKGLAYKKKSLVNWCPSCQTVLANEQVEQGRCWRCDSVVEQKPLEQWFFKITAYAEELLEQTYQLKGWPERVLTMQREWIGKSQGAEAVFKVEGSGEEITVFTTRPDTLYGVTFLSLAAEHPLLEKLIVDEAKKRELADFRERVRKIDRDKRLADAYEKEGIALGLNVIHPLTGAKVPLYAANFVLMEYGTGAVMAVPAHDQRDFDFAKKYGLPIKVVIEPVGAGLAPAREHVGGGGQGQALPLQQAYVDPGIMVDSDRFNGLGSEAAKAEIVKHLESQRAGKARVTYKLRDWGVSRQRYWGAPIPILYCDSCGAVPEKIENLPVKLPLDVEFSGEGGSPLSKIESFVHAKCPQCGGPARRETDTMDTFMESSWYFFRYLSPKDKEEAFSRRSSDYWMPVDQYIGGIEHAVLHLLYARFFTKVLRDLDYTGVSEPFKNLLTQGMVIKDGAKMSKSKGNVVDPEYLIDKYGADTARLFCLFASPPEKDLDWNDAGVEGSARFLNRVWKLLVDLSPLYISREGKGHAAKPESKMLRDAYTKLHQTTAKVTEDVGQEFHFNTAIASIMELVNKIGEVPRAEWESGEGKELLSETLDALVLLLSPFVPHFSEEAWKSLGHPRSLLETAWPSFDPEALVAETVTVIVQVNGKLRGRIELPPQVTEEEVKKLVDSDEKIRAHLEGKELVKTIFVPGKLLNLVVK
ncbi:MAG TPA: leucine--tRNA ligase [bacterium]|nr:leucine--tRNA ligase [bacterium]